ncbi:hypothetical protein Dimus_018016 [Dionaea muscipula]
MVMWSRRAWPTVEPDTIVDGGSRYDVLLSCGYFLRGQRCCGRRLVDAELGDKQRQPLVRKHEMWVVLLYINGDEKVFDDNVKGKE